MATLDTQTPAPAAAVLDSAVPSVEDAALPQAQAEPAKESKPRPPRQQRPNYAQIHAKPLPYEVFPLPAFIPHNPLSVVRVAIAMLSRTLWAPAPQIVIHEAYFSSETQSVHVTDAASIRALWEQGFFGSGSLSRSEPRWLDLEKRKRGHAAMQTSEEVTAQRRRERRMFKLERARLEAEAIEEQRRAEQKMAEDKKAEAKLAEQKRVEAEIAAQKLIEAEKLAKVPAYVWNAARLPLMGPGSTEDLPADDEKPAYVWNAARLPFMGHGPVEEKSTPAEVSESESQDSALDAEAQGPQDPEDVSGEVVLEDALLAAHPTEEQEKEALLASAASEADEDEVAPSEPAEITDQEHLQLTLYEAFFLSYVLGILSIRTTDGSKLDNSALLRLCCSHAHFPVDPTSIPTPTRTPAPIAPDNAFLLQYVAYHHFRSLGWVVRSGIKFATDFLLYNRGPAFSHAEFAVMVLPSYSHSYWSETEERKNACEKKGKRDWWWLHRVNRVQGLAHKTLMIVYVEVPPPWEGVEDVVKGTMDIGKVLKRYSVREFVIGRWTPNRHR